MTVRLLHFVVQPVLVVDDGDEITPAPALQPNVLTLKGLRDMADRWPEHLAQMAAQIEAGAPPEDDPAPVA